MNLPGYRQHEWVHGEIGFVPWVRNYITVYHQRQRMLRSSGVLPSGPIDIRHDPVLIAVIASLASA